MVVVLMSGHDRNLARTLGVCHHPRKRMIQ